MTEETTTTIETPEPEEAPENGSKAGREAAKYRRQLREAEAERDSLRASLTTTRGQLVRDALTGYKVNGNTFNIAALGDAGIDTDSMFSEDGALHLETLDTVMTELAETKPYMFTPRPRLVIPGEGNIPDSRETSAWEEAFTPEQQ